MIVLFRKNEFLLFLRNEIYPYSFSKSRAKIILINLSGEKKRMSDYNEEAYENALVELSRIWGGSMFMAQTSTVTGILRCMIQFSKILFVV